jgi:parallel beta-helix repeat protein
VAVDCNQGQTITGGLNSLPASGGTLLVSGICHEFVFIGEKFVNVTLDGQGTAEIHGVPPVAGGLPDSTISIKGRNITIQKFALITGIYGNTGVQVYGGATANVRNNTIEGAEDMGVYVSRASYARIFDNVIRNNKPAGIVVSDGGYARIGFVDPREPLPRTNTIVENRGDGIRVYRSANARIVGNTISGNQGHGVSVYRLSQADIASNTIEGNAGDGVNVREGSGANLGNVTGTSLIDLPNATSVNNGGFGVACSVGGYLSGRLGTLAGHNGAISIDGHRTNVRHHEWKGRFTCINNLSH